MLFPDDLDFVGNDLNRPECVLATRSGHLYSADWRGGVVITFPDGQSKLLKHRTSHPWLKPNGIALMPEGDFLVTHLGDETGGVYCLDGNGILTPFLEEVEKPFLDVVMQYTDWNITHASTMLGMNRATLRNRLKKYKLD